MSTVWTPLHAHVHITLRQRQLLQPQARSLVAVSGGQDSLCLMQLLLDLQPKWQWELAIAHCDHQWRPDSTANADYVEQLAHSWNVPFYRITASREEAAQIMSEAAARTWRYQTLVNVAQAQNYSCLVTGHTASDRTETLLFNLMRGSGADGLQALTWQRTLAPGVRLVRPLLSITRDETAQFCQDRELQVWEDATNQDRRYARNRMRHELIPYLKQHFNPDVETTLAQTAELLQADVEWLEAEAERLWQQSVTVPTSADSTYRIARQNLKSSPLALQRRVMRRVLVQGLPHAPTFDHIEKLVGLIHAPNRTQTDPFPGGAIARVDGEWIVLLKKPPTGETDRS